MTVHELKTWPEFFTAIREGVKTFDIRKDDRNFAVGDELILREWQPEGHFYTLAEPLERRVAYILRHRPDAGCAATFGLQPGYAILSITEID